MLSDALEMFGTVDVLTHAIRFVPQWHVAATGLRRTITVGVQPVLVHGEALFSGRLFRGRLLAEHYDLIWAVNSRYAGVARGARVPYVVWEATPIRDELRSMSAREVRRVGRGTGAGLVAHRATLTLGERIEGHILTNAIMVYAMSEYTRTRVLDIHHLPSTRVEVLLHPPSRAFLEALRRHGGATARRSPAIDAPPHLLFVGRADDPRKDLGLLFDACRLLESGGLSVHLTVVGPYSERWAQTRDLPRNTELLGPVDLDRLTMLYLSHDALVLSSRQEGFGIVVAEALHAGLPVVTTPCGGPEDVIHRSAGGLIAGFTPKELADAIRAIVTDREAWHRASRSGAHFAATELSFGQLTDRVRRILTRTTGLELPVRSSALAATSVV